MTTYTITAAQAGGNESAEAPDAACRELVAPAARDALRLNEWIRLCEMNQCEVVE